MTTTLTGEISIPREVSRKLLETRAGSTLLLILILILLNPALSLAQEQPSEPGIPDVPQAIVVQAAYPTLDAISSQVENEELDKAHTVAFHVYNQQDYSNIPMPGDSSSDTPHYTLAEYGCGIFAFTHVRSFFEDTVDHPVDQGAAFFQDSTNGIAMRVVADQLRAVGYDVESLPAMSSASMEESLRDGTYTLLLVGINDQDHPRGHMLIAFLNTEGNLSVVDSEDGSISDRLPSTVSGAYSVTSTRQSSEQAE